MLPLGSPLDLVEIPPPLWMLIMGSLSPSVPLYSCGPDVHTLAVVSSGRRDRWGQHLLSLDQWSPSYLPIQIVLTRLSVIGHCQDGLCCDQEASFLPYFLQPWACLSFCLLCPPPFRFPVLRGRAQLGWDGRCYRVFAKESGQREKLYRCVLCAIWWRLSGSLQPLLFLEVEILLIYFSPV